MFNLVPFNKRNRNLLDPEDFFADFFNNFAGFPSNQVCNFKSDIKETENEYIIQAELPGVNKDRIDIEVDNNYMTITASNDEVHEEENDNFIRRERRYGKFQRSFYIGNTDIEDIKADYQDGILEVKIPKNKKPEKTVRKIDIN